MASTTTRVKTIRMLNNVADWLDGLDARRVIECLYDGLSSGALVFDGHRIFAQKDEASGEVPKEEVKVESECPFDCREIVNACDEIGLDYDIALKRFTQAVYRGKL